MDLGSRNPPRRRIERVQSIHGFTGPEWVPQSTCWQGALPTCSVQSRLPPHTCLDSLLLATIVVSTFPPWSRQSCYYSRMAPTPTPPGFDAVLPRPDFLAPLTRFSSDPRPCLEPSRVSLLTSYCSFASPTCLHLQCSRLCCLFITRPLSASPVSARSISCPSPAHKTSSPPLSPAMR